MTCFQILSPLQSYSVFISSCLGGSGEQASLHTQCSQGWHNNPSDSITISSLLFRMHGWFNNALSCTPSQRSHLLDLPQGTQCKFPLSHSKLHAAVYCFGFFFFFLFNTASEDPNTKLHLKHLAYSSAAPGDCWEGFRAPLCDCPQLCLAAKLLIKLEMILFSSAVCKSFICLLSHWIACVL